jgi:hypothetical protein
VAGAEPPTAKSADEGLRPASDPQEKFAFSLSELEPGYREDADGARRPIRYEYCIPKSPKAIAALPALDPTVLVDSRGKGTADCTDEQLLAHGHTGQPDYLEALRKIAEQPFVQRIVIAEED